MGCCGSGGPRRIRKQIVNRPKKAQKQVAIHRIKRTPQPQPTRQRIHTTQKCGSCGFPTIMINIAGRERLQCSNTSCRKIVR